MALVIKDRVKETTTTTGTGTYTLAGAVSGFETFTANLSNSDTTYYVCTDNTDFEVGLGTFTSSGTTLSRDTILASSNSNNEVNWSSGTRSIFMTYPADKAVFKDASNNINGTFVGNITGNVTGNTSGTAATVTSAAQTNITSLGTLTALTVDDVAIDGKVVTLTGSTSDTATLTAGTNGTLDIVTTDAGGASANIQITADGTAELAGTTVTLDSSGGITLDADGGTITFADGGSSLGTITSSGFTGNVVGNVSGTAATVTGAAQTNITSIGTLASNLNLGGQDIVTTTSNQDIDLQTHGTGKVVIKGNTDDSGSNPGAIKLNCEANSHGQTLKAAPHSESATNTITLPSSGGDARLVTTSSTATLTNKTFDVEGTGNSISNIDVADLKSGVLDTDISGGVSGSDDTLASAKAIKTYVDAQSGGMTNFILEDGDGTEVTVADGKEVKFVEGGGIDINWTDTSTGSDGDPYDLTFTINAAQTDITSLLATDIKIGEDDQTKIDFETADTINFYAGNEKQLILTDGALTPGTNAIVDLGTDALEFKDAYFDGTVEADAITIGGTALSEVISDTAGAMFSSNTETGVTVTYQDADNTIDVAIDAAQTDITSVVNTSLEIGRDADNRIKFGTDNQIIFEVSGGDNVIFKASGEIEASSLDISGDADIDGTLEADAITVDGTALNTVIAGVTVANATTAAVATTVTITDNDSTNEDNAIVFTAGGDVDGGNIGLESDGDLTYNPSTGRLTATQLAGTLQTAAQTNITSVGTLSSLTTSGNIELGHASDTTISRSASGTVQIEGSTVLTVGNSDAPSTTTSSSDVDFVLIDDGGTMKKITVANLGTATTADATALAIALG